MRDIFRIGILYTNYSFLFGIFFLFFFSICFSKMFFVWKKFFCFQTLTEIDHFSSFVRAKRTFHLFLFFVFYSVHISLLFRISFKVEIKISSRKYSCHCQTSKLVSAGYIDKVYLAKEVGVLLVKQDTFRNVEKLSS